MIKKIKLMPVLVLLGVIISIKAQEKKQPNIIYILADDAGYGDLGVYGQEKIPTPNIDQLAKDGMKFTQHYSGSTVCSPSRSSLLTGQHTGHTPIRGNRGVKGKEGEYPIPSSYITIAEVLKEKGYTTGVFGKWGVGYVGSEGDPGNQGFDEFFGYNSQGIAHKYYPEHLRHNQEKYILEGNDWEHTVTYAQDVIHEKTLDFIEDNKDKPFFAYVPLVLPHAELIVPNDSIFKKFDGKFEETKPYKGNKKSGYNVDDGQKFTYKYAPQEKPRATFASMIYRMDVYVGQIVSKLKELGIEDNTIIMFASDNGPHAAGGADPKFFNSSGGLKGIKRDLYEGGIRTAFIVKWPNKVKAGTTSGHISAFWDVMPTFADIAKTETPEQTDGISFLPTLLGNSKKQKQHEYLYWEFYEKGGRIALRKDNWKAIVYNVKKKENTKYMLFDLSKDPKENNNVIDQYPEIFSEIKELMKKSHVDISPYKMKLTD